MASKLNHHFVPKYLFRLFSGGEDYVHLVLKASSKVVFRASIRHQCAHHKFYGTDEIEDYLSMLDGRHATACFATTGHGLAPLEGFALLGPNPSRNHLIAEPRIKVQFLVVTFKHFLEILSPGPGGIADKIKCAFEQIR